MQAEPDRTMEHAEPEVSRRRADALITWLRQYAEHRINSRLMDERRSIPPYIVLDLGNRGILGMQVPATHGGLALRTTDAMRVTEQLAAIDLTLASFVGVNNCLGVRPVARYAVPAVREELLPALAAGRELAAFALTEPKAGSNPRALQTTAVRRAGGGWTLQGTKIWSGSASWAGVINVFAQLLDDRGRSQGITAFVVRQGTPGLRMGPEALTLGMRGMVQNTVCLDRVEVGPESLLGEAGGGMEVGQDAMMAARLGIGSLCVGGMKRCAQLMVRYAARRSIGTGRLLDNPVSLARLSELTAGITALEAYIARVAALADGEQGVPDEAYCACKTAGPELLWQAADGLVQMLGGRGYIETNMAPQILRDARLLRIFEGPTETLHMFLGSRVVNAGDTLARFLSSVLAAPWIADRLAQTADRLVERSTAPQDRADPRSRALQWAYGRIGELATWALLAAAARQTAEARPEGEARRGADWAEDRFEAACNGALAEPWPRPALLGSDSLTEVVSGYAASIGDPEQGLPGEETGPDAYLRRRQPSGGVPRPVETADTRTDEVESLLRHLEVLDDDR